MRPAIAPTRTHACRARTTIRLAHDSIVFSSALLIRGSPRTRKPSVLRKQAEMRRLCSCARAPVLAVVLIVGSCSYAADGGRTTPNASGGSADAARLDGSTAAADGGTNNKSHQATTMLHDSKPPAEDELLLVMMARQRVASGSRLPDCLHACGACSPCRRVIVSFECAESESESCPMAYRCMCRGRFFRVPSL